VPVGRTFDQRLNLMFDMIALAYQANLTPRVHLHDGRRGQQRHLQPHRVSDAFHPLSHHQNDKSRKERLVKIQTYHSQAFAKFLTKLAAMPDGDGSVLDHSILLYGSNMSNSNAHDEFPLRRSSSAAGPERSRAASISGIRTRRRSRTCI
jgi:hypothetical protein